MTGAPDGAIMTPALDTRQLLELHAYMRLTRSVEGRLGGLHRPGELAGDLDLSQGQEATSVGSAYALEPGDLLGPLMRDLGAILVRGYTPRECFAQYVGRDAGPTHGREDAHFGEVGGRGIVSATGMVGDLISVMAGCGLGLQMRKSDRVCLTYIGDGGTSTGGFHEGLNLAAVRKLPLILIIENDGAADSTPIAHQTRQPAFAMRGPAYGCPGESVDGNDVLAIHEATRRAIARARAGEGPTVIEAKMLRRTWHAEHDEAPSVPAGVAEESTRKDPIERYERWLIAEGIAARAQLDAVAADIESRLDADLEWARNSPLPEAGAGSSGVHAAESALPPPPDTGTTPGKR